LSIINHNLNPAELEELLVILLKLVLVPAPPTALVDAGSFPTLKPMDNDCIA